MVWEKASFARRRHVFQEDALFSRRGALSFSKEACSSTRYRFIVKQAQGLIEESLRSRKGMVWLR